MQFKKRISFIIALLSIFGCHGLIAQTVRIMPLGNSITYDHNSFDDSNPRPIGDRISYRYRLYQMLSQEGLDFDFVGSEDAGNNFFRNGEYDDNAGFPGIQTNGLANLISTGYDNYGKRYVSPGPYLNYFPADIILLHIGTNNLTTSPDHVEDLLNNIRYYDSDVIILVARILNRRTYHPPTSTFNNNVEYMVNARGDSRIRIVNIETGASINYLADMIDDLHPNVNGYNKMAAKWFEEIMNLNQKPVITSIPTQNTDKGESFPALVLDQYVSDAEDPDFMLVWSYQKAADSKLTISIDANRIMRVTPDPEWSGIETVELKVKDSGSGAFVQSATVDVTFAVEHVNSPPVITSVPPTHVYQGSSYNYTVTVSDPDNDSISCVILNKPSWLSYNSTSRLFSGIPEDPDVGNHQVALQVSDGYEVDDQVFQITVEDVNDPPVMTSSPNPEVYQDEYFTYNITATDVDGDYITYQVIDKPTWLNYNVTLHTLTGRPTNNEVGDSNFTVKLSDGTVDVLEPVVISVINVNDPPVITSDPITTVELGESYLYYLRAEDIDAFDTLQYSAVNLPDWLTLLPLTGEALIYGTPSESDYGSNLVILQVSDGSEVDLQAFNLNVSFPNGIQESGQGLVQRIYPNPASNRITFTLAGIDNTTIHIYNSTGILQTILNADQAQSVEADISGLPEGIYIYKVYQGDAEGYGKFIKR